MVWTDYFFGLQGADRESCIVSASETVKQTNFQDPHIVGVHWAAACMMEWVIIFGSIDFNYPSYLLECIATPNQWNRIEIAF